MIVQYVQFDGEQSGEASGTVHKILSGRQCAGKSRLQ